MASTNIPNLPRPPHLREKLSIADTMRDEVVKLKLNRAELERLLKEMTFEEKMSRKWAKNQDEEMADSGGNGEVWSNILFFAF